MTGCFRRGELACGAGKSFPWPLAVVLAVCAIPALAADERRSLNLDDLARLHDVSDPQVSPDGRWVAHVVESVDTRRDEKRSALWMVSWDGSQQIRLTQESRSATSPRWSPDGRYLAFLAARSDEDDQAQVWLLDRRGGEARRLTDFELDISEYAWSPDAKRLAVVARPVPCRAPGAKRAGEKCPARPIVVDRYYFKNDRDGYLSPAAPRRIHLYEIASGSLAPLTPETIFDESMPAWSPDGSAIAFVSNRNGEQWDRTINTDVYVAQSRPASPPRRLTTFEGRDLGPLSWSPDGRSIAYVQGSEPRYSIYGVRQAAVVAADGGPARLLAPDLDRDAAQPRFAEDRRFIDFLVEDDRSVHPARVAVSSGALRRLADGHIVVAAYSTRAGRTAMLVTNADAPPEVYAFDNGALRRLTTHNDSWLGQVQLSATEEISFRSKDGTEVHGLLTRALPRESSRLHPGLLWLHGGPYSQDDHAFDFRRQLFAANGYVVIEVNFRGSSGRGVAYGRSIFADWGNKDVEDVLAAADYTTREGLADRERLGIGGWSYGGILTNYVIASDSRFKAAVSGAASANQLSMYGSDQYVFAYENEFEPPWRNPDRWIRLSYPFFHADRIRTPTLLLGGDRDFNVPIAGSEQMYQALQSLRIPTQLVVYPGEKHLLVRPSFVHDSLQRYLAWFERFLQPDAAPLQTRSDR